jgi:carboxypeptidase Taq
MTAYEKLRARMHEVALLGGSSSVLSWDQETHMPPKGTPVRAQQLGYLAGLAHRLATASEVGDWIQSCEEEDGSNPERTPNIREWRRDYDRSTRVPAALVEELTCAESFAREAWVQAKGVTQFSTFEPHLDKLVRLCRRKADHLGFADSPYDALMDLYEPGLTVRTAAPLLADLQESLVALLPELQAKTSRLPGDALQGVYPIPAQQAFNHEVAAAMGFDFAAGRIDTTAHPFCSGIGPGDCRLTTRYDERDFTSSLFGVMHEAGHGLYEQGLPAEAYGTPLGEAVSLGIHESQSRLWENHVGRSREFWRHWYSRAGDAFPHLRKIAPDDFWLLINRIEPSFIRVEADELTYHLHIILRFEIEKALIEGTLEARDVPTAWNERFKALFGMTVPDDAKGCLQDVHWSSGLFGYFPTYTLGSLNAAQIFAAAQRQIPTLAGDLAEGRCASLLQWLRKHVHVHGRRYLPAELIRLATVEPPKAKYLIDHLKTKFGSAAE